MSDHVFQVGDLVTTPRMRDWAGKDKLLVCRIGLSGGEHLLFPLQVHADLPRPFRSADLTLVEAWTGPRLVRCNADASEIVEAGAGRVI